MADYFQSQPNFTNPSYATPEQLATQRAYAAELQKSSGQDVNRPAGAAANFINALMAGVVRNRADSTQQQAAQQNASDQTALITQLQGGQKVDPATIAHIYSNPMASPESRALITALIKPEPVKSEYGQPAYQSPVGGVQAAPIQGNFQPAYRVHQGAEGVSTDAPFPAPGAPAPGVSPSGPPVQPSPKVWGDQEAQAAGLYPPQAVPVPAPRPAAAPQGGPVPPAAAPPQPSPGAPTGPLTLDALAAKGREFAAQKAYTQGIAGAQTNIATADLDAAASAPTIKRVAGVMLDDLHTHGDKMTFGPTAEWSNNVKRVAANYAPGLMKDQLESLASADSFDKMSAQLTSMLAKGGGTDAQLFNNMKSVPGSHNSKEGAEALLKMVSQVADQQQGLRQYTAGAKTAQEYEQLRNQYYAQNPIVNPLTGNPIKQDLEKNAATDNGGFKVIKVH